MNHSMAVETVPVALGQRSYDIHIGSGLLEKAGALLSPLLPRSRTVVVTDENVATVQLPRLEKGLRECAVELQTIILPAGEQTKSFKQLEALTARLLELGVERNDIIIALGGGVIGDLVGFSAAILRRGCRFAQIPTTLLAQVDSSVGGKTAINTSQGKNLVGAFHQPAIVIADVNALETLSARQMRAGYAEVLKYGALGDARFFDWLEANGEAVLDGDTTARVEAIKTSCLVKSSIVAADETEKGARALLNLGHTFGHAFEAAYGYSDTLLHGEGVAVGMALAFEYSARMGLAPATDAERLKSHLRSLRLPAGISDLSSAKALTAETLAAHMMQDKKVEQGELTLILANAIGKAKIVKNVSRDDIEAFLKEKIAETQH